MVFLKAYFDESGIHDGAEFSLIAGYVSTVPHWDALSTEWQNCIDAWGIDPFHMSEAEAKVRSGLYKDWTDTQRNERVAELARLIAKYADVGFAHIIPKRVFDEHVLAHVEAEPEMQEAAIHAYQMSYIHIVNWMHQLCRWNRIQPQDLMIVFGKNSKIGGRSREFWRELVEVAGFNEPQFLPMKGYPPLQAADMLAWRSSRDKSCPDEAIPPRHVEIRERKHGLKEFVFTHTMPDDTIIEIGKMIKHAIVSSDVRWNGAPWETPEPVRKVRSIAPAVTVAALAVERAMRILRFWRR